MNTSYHAIITRDECDYWTVDFPDLPGCCTFGESYDHALDMAAEALSGWIEVALSNGEPLPTPCYSGGIKISIK